MGRTEAENAVGMYRALAQIGVGEQVNVTVAREGEELALEWRMPFRTELRVRITEDPDATARQMSIRNGFLTGAVDRSR